MDSETSPPIEPSRRLADTVDRSSVWSSAVCCTLVGPVGAGFGCTAQNGAGSCELHSALLPAGCVALLDVARSCARWFTHYIHNVRMRTPLIDGLGYATSTMTVPVSHSRTGAFRQNRHINIRARVALKPLVSLISRLVACSSRISVDTQTDTQNDYRNPRCACAPRVNDELPIH